MEIVNGNPIELGGFDADADGKVDLSAGGLDLDLSALSGVLRVSGGVAYASSTLDHVVDGSTYARVLGSFLASGKVIKLHESGGKDLTVVLGAANRVLTLGADVSLDQDLQTSDSPAFTGLTVDGGDLTLSGTATNHLVLPSNNDAATPTLAFGTGVGLYSTSVNNMSMALGGANTWSFAAGYMGGAAGNMSKFRYLAATATAPNILPRGDDDLDTGIGSAAVDQLSLIAGGVEGIRVTESTTISVRCSDKLSVSNTVEGNTGQLNIQTAHETHTLAGAKTSDTTTISIPAGATLLGVSFCVNTAVSDDDGNDTWSAAFVTGSTATLGTAEAAAKQTKVNTMIVPEIASDVCQVRFTANGSNFDGGVIEVIAYYLDLTSLADGA